MTILVVSSPWLICINLPYHIISTVTINTVVLNAFLCMHNQLISILSEGWNVADQVAIWMNSLGSTLILYFIDAIGGV